MYKYNDGVIFKILFFLYSRSTTNKMQRFTIYLFL